MTVSPAGRACELFSGLVDPAPAEVIAQSGFDSMLIDGEHAPHDLRSIMGHSQATAPYDIASLARAATDLAASSRPQHIGQ